MIWKTNQLNTRREVSSCVLWPFWHTVAVIFILFICVGIKKKYMGMAKANGEKCREGDLEQLSEMCRMGTEVDVFPCRELSTGSEVDINCR